MIRSISLKHFAALFVLLVAVFYLLVGGERYHGVSLTLSDAQNLIFPLVFALIIVVPQILNFRPLPFPVLAFAGLFFIKSLFIVYGPPISKPGTALVARMSDDRFEIGSRIFRERVSAFQRTPRADLGKIHQEIFSVAQAWDLLEKGEVSRPILWIQREGGDKQWVHILFPKQIFNNWFHDTDRIIDILYRVHLVTYLPLTGVSASPEGNSAEFIARLLDGTLPYENSERKRSEAIEEQLMTLQEAAELRYSWNTFGHRAYIYWLVGTLEMEKAFLDGGIREGPLKCATDAYFQGLSLLPPTEHIELRTALLNNLAVSVRVRGLLTKDIKMMRQSSIFFSDAAALSRYPSFPGYPVVAGAIARQNLEILAEARAMRDMKRRALSGKDSSELPK